MATEHFDVAIIGGGPGGYAAALYGASAGLHIAATLRRHRDDAAVVAAAAADGIALQPLSAYAVSAAPPPGLLLGYGAIQTDRIAEGLRRLRRCLDRTQT